MKLFIDAGNTRTKWAIYNQLGELIDQGVVPNEIIRSTNLRQLWAGCTKSVISCVASEEIANAIKGELESLELKSFWLSSRPEACGVKNSYHNPSQLGMDRWAGAIAGWHQFYSPCVVVSLGTAVTIDAVALDTKSGQPEFIGGLIIPGIQLMKNCLLNQTAKIRFSSGNYEEFPKNTGDAVHSGAILSIAGAINTMVCNLSGLTTAFPVCMVTGGDAHLLDKVLKKMINTENQLFFFDDLVIRGLILMERECS